MFSPGVRLYTYQGLTYSLSAWAKEIGVTSGFLSYRLDKRKLSFEDAAREAETFVRLNGKVSFYGGIEHPRRVPRTTPHVHNLRDTREYQIWSTIKQQCYNVNHPNYQHVGARGIGLCDQWLHNFSQFYEDVKLYPPGKYFVLIDPTQDYSPENCRWVDKNDWRTNAVWLTAAGERLHISGWAKKIGISCDYFVFLLERCCTCDKAVEKAERFLETAKQTGLHRGKKRNIKDERFGLLVAKERVGADKSRNSLWRCECDCGGEAIVQLGNLFSGHTKSCGCLYSTTRTIFSRKSLDLEFAGIRLSLTQWAKRLGLPNSSALSYRLQKQSFSQILKESLMSGRCRLKTIFGDDKTVNPLLYLLFQFHQDDRDKTGSKKSWERGENFGGFFLP
jgi:hypothetical protein